MNAFERIAVASAERFAIEGRLASYRARNEARWTASKAVMHFSWFLQELSHASPFDAFGSGLQDAAEYHAKAVR